MGNPSSLEARIKRLELMAQNGIRVGKVAQLDADGCKVRVTFPDRENVLSHWLRVMVHNTKENKDYWMPDLDEDVICVFLSTGMETGFVLGSYYPEPVARPAGTEDVRCVEFADGGRMEYDRKKKRWLFKTDGVFAVQAPKILLDGDTFVSGKLHANASLHVNGSGFATESFWPASPTGVPPLPKPEV